MTKIEKTCLRISVVYSAILIITFILFFISPEWRIFGVAWNALFQVFGTTVGTTIIIVIFTTLLARKRISTKIFILSIVHLLIVSLVCFIITFNAMMGI